VVGEKVGVGGDDAEKIVEGVGDELIFGGREGGRVGSVQGELDLGSLSKMRFGFIFHEARGNGRVERVSGKGIEREAARGAGSAGLGIEIGDRGRIEGEDGESGVLRADFFDELKALEIPGMDVESDGVPMAGGEFLEEIGEGIETMEVERRAG